MLIFIADRVPENEFIKKRNLLTMLKIQRCAFARQCQHPAEVWPKSALAFSVSTSSAKCKLFLIFLMSNVIFTMEC